MRIVLLGAILAPAIAFSSPGFAWSEDNCRAGCVLTAGRERAQTCIEQVPCAKYRGQPAVSEAEVRRRVAAYKAGKRNNGTPSTFVDCARRAGARPGPRGWLYNERQVPAMNACITARAGNNRKGQ
jgi:hypothetical protein